MFDENANFAILMQRLQSGEPEAFVALYTQFGEAIRRAVRQQLHDRLRVQFDSLDFVQDVWASFLALPPEGYTFVDPESLTRFLSRIARNKVIEVFRRRFQTQGYNINREQRLESPLEQGETTAEGAEATPSQNAMAHERWEELKQSLPVGHRGILERLREGHTHEDIARILGVSPRTIERVSVVSRVFARCNRNDNLIFTCTHLNRGGFPPSRTHRAAMAQRYGTRCHRALENEFRAGFAEVYRHRPGL